MITQGDDGQHLRPATDRQAIVDQVVFRWRRQTGFFLAATSLPPEEARWVGPALRIRADFGYNTGDEFAILCYSRLPDGRGVVLQRAPFADGGRSYANAHVLVGHGLGPLLALCLHDNWGKAGSWRNTEHFETYSTHLDSIPKELLESALKNSAPQLEKQALAPQITGRLTRFVDALLQAGDHHVCVVNEHTPIPCLFGAMRILGRRVADWSFSTAEREIRGEYRIAFFFPKDLRRAAGTVVVDMDSAEPLLYGPAAVILVQEYVQNGAEAVRALLKKELDLEEEYDNARWPSLAAWAEHRSRSQAPPSTPPPSESYTVHPSPHYPGFPPPTEPQPSASPIPARRHPPTAAALIPELYEHGHPDAVAISEMLAKAERTEEISTDDSANLRVILLHGDFFERWAGLNPEYDLRDAAAEIIDLAFPVISRAKGSRKDAKNYKAGYDAKAKNDFGGLAADPRLPDEFLAELSIVAHRNQWDQKFRQIALVVVERTIVRPSDDQRRFQQPQEGHPPFELFLGYGFSVAVLCFVLWVVEMALVSK